MANIFLSFNKGKKSIAFVKGGDYDGSIISIYDPKYDNPSPPIPKPKQVRSKSVKRSQDETKEEEKEERKTPFDTYDEATFLGANYFSKLKKRLTLVKQNTLIQHIRSRTEPVDAILLPHYEACIDLLTRNKGVSKEGKDVFKEIILDEDSSFTQIPIISDTQRDVLYVAGASGSGKSYYTASYARNFKKIFPNKPIYVFSQLHDDKVIDALEPIRITINEEMLEEPIHIDELERGSLVIFDDTDAITEKKLLNAVNALKRELLEVGRHNRIYIVITSHLINNHNQTKTILNECTSITVFPQGGSKHAINYVCTKYLGFSKHDVEKLLKQPSRWVTVLKAFPTTILTENTCYLLSA